MKRTLTVALGGRANCQIRSNAFYDTPVGTRQFPVTVASQIQ